ncbi:26957_t:CDS:2 [Racocetra persica]|uniref:26957_t:CDS:1 n=1 Tax=Racocetra persica TaxID=160502 RepID=A0ACA9LNU4_9GLOM|nr:26957_t:CDS:2 [Racocetra persica]
MHPPPSVTYENADDLFQSIQIFANSQVYTSSEELQRQTSIWLIDYPFELYAGWCAGLWYIEVCNRIHNHDLSENLSGYPMCHRLTEQQLINILEITTSDSHLQEIISTIHQNSLLLLVINKDIYNACDRLRKQSLEGHTPVEALIDKLREGGYMYEYK